VNLLDNAARHGPPGSVVAVAARTEGERTVVEVADEGPGIAPEERDRVFERFTRGERAVGGGTGLGLSIARWAVDLHGGRIGVAEPADPSAPGCRIRITLPGVAS
jgi:signal transduction histidine kinase